jgi:hypothetical protein
MKCPICLKFNNNYKDAVSFLCKFCKALVNTKANKYNYYIHGEQNLPDKHKKMMRLKNSQSRFNIMKNFYNKEDLFIDIGCGSGEMLEIAKKYFKNSIGYEHGKLLFNSLKLNYKVYNRNFNIKDIKSFNKENGIVISICHVLEHNFNPINLLYKIISKLKCQFVLYIEVPLYTGYSFKKHKYNYKLWYDQHLALYHMKTLEFISKKLKLKIIDTGFRVFYSDNINKKEIIKIMFNNTYDFIRSFFEKKTHSNILDYVKKDYGYILLKN